jgi:putative DNA primase/helicase
MQIPARDYALAPVLPMPGLAMLYGPRGMGKTYVALSIGLASASGGTALRWQAPRPRRVLYIDGEMPAGQLQERLARLIRAAAAVPEADALKFLAADLMETGLPSIARPEMQQALDTAAADADVLILDNLSTLAGGIRENEADDWEGVQRWLLAQRRAGRLVLIIHHAGKGGQQRGTSRREDVMDTVIAMRRPADYEPALGARVELHLEKARGVVGADAEPFLANLTETANRGLTWAISDLAGAQRDRAAEMLRHGLSIRDVAEATGMSKSAVQRLKTRLNGTAETGDG